MSLHDEIMNLPIPNDFDYCDFPNKVIAYKNGHRDARHDSAELSSKYDSLIQEFLDRIENFGGEIYVARIRKEYNL